MNLHHRSQAGIVNLNALDAILHNNSPPLSINRYTVRQESHTGLDSPDFALGLRDRQSETVAGHRTCDRVPKFSDILVCVMKHSALTGESNQRCIDQMVLRIAAPRQ